MVRKTIVEVTKEAAMFSLGIDEMSDVIQKKF